MKNNNIQFLVIVIIVALIAGVIGSVIAGKITGNAISVFQKAAGNPKVYTTSEVYSKAEVDKKLDCRSSPQYRIPDTKIDGKSINGKTGNDICKLGGPGMGDRKICFLGYGGIVKKDTDYFNFDVSGLLSCDSPLPTVESAQGTFIVQYLCCSNTNLKN